MTTGGSQTAECYTPTKCLCKFLSARNGTPRELGACWVLRKGKRQARCEMWSHVFGWELRLIASGELLRSQVCRTQEEVFDIRGPCCYSGPPRDHLDWNVSRPKEAEASAVTTTLRSSSGNRLPARRCNINCTSSFSAALKSSIRVSRFTEHPGVLHPPFITLL
jgi:hypothetical protein